MPQNFNLLTATDSIQQQVVKWTEMREALASNFRGGAAPSWLDIGGSFVDDNNANQMLLRFKTGGSAFTPAIRIDTDGTAMFTGGTTDRGFRFNGTDFEYRDGSTAAMRFSSAGLTIGTASPTLPLSVEGTSAVRLPSGPTADRPAAANALIRHNADTGRWETCTNVASGTWDSFAYQSDITNVSPPIQAIADQAANFAGERVVVHQGTGSSATLYEVSNDTSLAGNRENALVTEQAAKGYTDAATAAGTVDTQRLADASVSTQKVIDRAITAGKIGLAQILEENLADDSVTTAKMGTSSVDARVLRINGNGVRGQLPASRGDGQFEWVNPPTFTIGSNTIVETMIADDSVGVRQLDTPNNPAEEDILAFRGGGLRWIDPAVDRGVAHLRDVGDVTTSANPADGRVLIRQSSAWVDGKITKDSVGDSAIETAGIKDAAVTAAKIGPAAVRRGNLDTENTGSIGQVLTQTSGGMAWAAGGGGGGGGVATRLNDLLDVHTPAPAGGSALTWDNADARWEATTIGSTGIETAAVTSAKIAAGAVTSSKVGTAQINASHLAANSVGRDELITATGGSNGQVLTRTASGMDWTSAGGGSGSGTVSGLTDTIIGTPADGQLLGFSSSNNAWINTAVGSTGIANGAIVAGKLAANSVTNTSIRNGAVDNDKLADDSVDLGEIKTSNTGSSGQFLRRTIDGLEWDSPSVSIGTGSIVGTMISNGAVTSNKIASNAITNAKLDDDSVDLPELKTATAGAQGQFLKRTSNGLDWGVPATTIGSGTIVGTMIADSAVSDSKLAGRSVTLGKIRTISSGTSGQVLSRTASGLDWVNQSGGGGGGASVTISENAPSSPSAGDMWVDADTLQLYIYYSDGDSSQWVGVTSDVAIGAMADMSDVTVSNPKDGNLVIYSSTDQGWSNGRIGASSLDTDSSGTVGEFLSLTSSGIDWATPPTNIADGAITHGMLGTDIVEGDNIADNQIDSNHLRNLSVGSAAISNGAVTITKIASAAFASRPVARALTASSAIMTPQRVNDANDRLWERRELTGYENSLSGAIGPGQYRVGASGGLTLNPKTAGSDRTDLGNDLIVGRRISIEDGTGARIRGEISSVGGGGGSTAFTLELTDSDSSGTLASGTGAVIYVEGESAYLDRTRGKAFKSVGLGQLNTATAGSAGQFLSRTASGLSWQAGGLPGAGEITHAMLGADIVEADNVKDDAIGSEHLDTSSSGTAGQVLSRTSAGMDWISITQGGLPGAGEITHAMLGAGIVESDNIAADAVQSAAIGDDQIGTEHLNTAATGSQGQVLTRGTGTAMDWAAIPGPAAGSITHGMLGSDIVEADNIADDAVGAEHLNTTSSGTAGQVLTRTAGGINWQAASGGGGGASVAISETPPSNPNNGDLWVDSETIEAYVYYNDGNTSQWAGLSAVGGLPDGAITRPKLATTTSGTQGQVLTRGSGTSMAWAEASGGGLTTTTEFANTSPYQAIVTMTGDYARVMGIVQTNASNSATIYLEYKMESGNTWSSITSITTQNSYVDLEVMRRNDTEIQIRAYLNSTRTYTLKSVTAGNIQLRARGTFSTGHGLTTWSYLTIAQ